VLRAETLPLPYVQIETQVNLKEQIAFWNLELNASKLIAAYPRNFTKVAVQAVLGIVAVCALP